MKIATSDDRLACVTVVARMISEHGPIPTVRVSSAQASCRYSYWGAVRYEIRLAADGAPTCVACERASSDRRSVAGAERDAAAIAEREGRLPWQRIGRLREADAEALLRTLAARAEVVS